MDNELAEIEELLLQVEQEKNQYSLDDDLKKWSNWSFWESLGTVHAKISGLIEILKFHNDPTQAKEQIRFMKYKIGEFENRVSLIVEFIDSWYKANPISEETMNVISSLFPKHPSPFDPNTRNIWEYRTYLYSHVDSVLPIFEDFYRRLDGIERILNDREALPQLELKTPVKLNEPCLSPFQCAWHDELDIDMIFGEFKKSILTERTRLEDFRIFLKGGAMIYSIDSNMDATQLSGFIVGLRDIGLRARKFRRYSSLVFTQNGKAYNYNSLRREPSDDEMRPEVLRAIQLLKKPV